MNKSPLDYRAALLDTLCNKEFVASYDRLTGSALGSCLGVIGRDALAHQIDVATGRLQEEIKKFNLFFFDTVWSRLPSEAFVAPPTKQEGSRDAL